MAQQVKNPLQCWRCEFDPWVEKIPWRRKWQPSPVFLQSDPSYLLNNNDNNVANTAKHKIASRHPHGSVVKNLPANVKMQETWVRSLGQEDLLEKGMSTHSSILAWRIPWTQKLQSMGLQ